MQLAAPRRMSHGNIRHSLEAIVVIGQCTVMCGGEGIEAMELIGNARKRFLSLFLSYLMISPGPSHSKKMPVFSWQSVLYLLSGHHGGSPKEMALWED